MERRLNTSITIFIFITYQKFVFTKTILLQRDERFLKTFITFEGTEKRIKRAWNTEREGIQRIGLRSSTANNLIVRTQIYSNSNRPRQRYARLSQQYNRHHRVGSRGTESLQNYDRYLTPIRPAELIKPAVPFVNYQYVNNFVNTKTGQNSSNIETGTRSYHHLSPTKVHVSIGNSKADGNCFFRSIAIGLRGIDNDQDHILIRYYGMQELLGMKSDGFPVENAWCLEPELGHRDIKSYAAIMMQPARSASDRARWGNACDAIALTRVLHRPIVVAIHNQVDGTETAAIFREQGVLEWKKPIREYSEFWHSETYPHGEENPICIWYNGDSNAGHYRPIIPNNFNAEWRNIPMNVINDRFKQEFRYRRSHPTHISAKWPGISDA